MNGLAVCYKGIEDISAKEISEMIKCKTEIKEGCVKFECDLDKLALLCYKGQSVNRVLLLLDEFKINNLSDLKRVNKIDFSKWLKGRTFAARSEIINNDLTSGEVEKTTGDEVDGKVDLDNPDITIFVYIFKNNCYVGIDLSGDISKREYKIFASPTSLKGTIAYSLARIGGYEKDKKLLDPFCGSGEIAIEAALFGIKFPLNFFNKTKFPFLKLTELDLDKVDKETRKEKLKINAFDTEQRKVKAAEKNAKIAGVNKSINFSRTNTEFLELKFKDQDVDMIITNIPRLTKQVSKVKIEKLYKKFFYQADYILKKQGKIVICCKDIDLLKESAGEEKFKLIEEREIEHGKEVLKVIVFSK